MSRFTALVCAVWARHACGLAPSPAARAPAHRRAVALRSASPDETSDAPDFGDAPSTARRPLLRVLMPSQEEAVARGIREWPGFLRKSRDFVDDAAPGTMRYVRGGCGGGGTRAARAGADDEPRIDIAANTLSEVDGKCELSWSLKEPLTLLTPDFEQKELFITVAGTLLVEHCGVLFNPEWDAHRLHGRPKGPRRIQNQSRDPV